MFNLGNSKTDSFVWRRPLAGARQLGTAGFDASQFRTEVCEKLRGGSLKMGWSGGKSRTLITIDKPSGDCSEEG